MSRPRRRRARRRPGEGQGRTNQGQSRAELPPRPDSDLVRGLVAPGSLLEARPPNNTIQTTPVIRGAGDNLQAGCGPFRPAKPRAGSGMFGHRSYRVLRAWSPSAEGGPFQPAFRAGCLRGDQAARGSRSPSELDEGDERDDHDDAPRQPSRRDGTRGRSRSAPWARGAGCRGAVSAAFFSMAFPFRWGGSA